MGAFILSPSNAAWPQPKRMNKTAFSRQNGVCTSPTPEEYAMKTLSRFVAKFTSLIVVVQARVDLAALAIKGRKDKEVKTRK